ncbi:MAG: hypothetical protein LW768_22045 [Rubrivivax sp.]|nr:hypothetical protein [Rubrivivax sp.]
MKLVAFSPNHLRPGEPLPFGLYAATGQLMLAPGQKIADIPQLRALVAKPLYVEESETAEWRRRLAAAMDTALRQGATLKQVAAVRPEQASVPGTRAALSLPEQWEELVTRHDVAMRSIAPDGDWPQRLVAIHKCASDLALRRSDGSLYYLVYQAGQSTERYASHHAMLVMLMAEAAARQLGLPGEQIDTLGMAALTMNVAMHKLQDRLAQSEVAPTAAMRAQLDAHPGAGAAMIEAAGMTDALLLGIVRQHHDGSPLAGPLAGQATAVVLARLLRRVDIFCAKISLRATRKPVSPVQAAREACIDAATGRPDEIGAALLKSVGLYPPGSFVELASGELGIVIGLGRRANLPYVASLVAASGNALGEPALRDTLDRRYSIKCAVPSDRVRVRPPHDRLLAMA